MTPHHCRHCGTLLRTWHERESHLDARAANDGSFDFTMPRLSPEEVARRRPLNDTFDMKKMRERLNALNAQSDERASLLLVHRAEELDLV